MRILAFSDLHHSPRHAAVLVEAAREADLVIGAGDFCNMRQNLAEALSLLEGIAAPFVVVPGNAESFAELQAAALPGMQVLHGSSATVADLTIFGLGYAVPETPFGGWSCELNEAQAATMMAASRSADILVSHSPPKGVVDVTSQGHSVGSTSVRDAIARIEPALVICGHIHDCWGQEGRIGPTRVVNLGPTPTWFDM